MTASDMNAIISLMPVAGRFSLVFAFQRLLKYDKELAYAICNSQDRFALCLCTSLFCLLFLVFESSSTSC